MSAGVFVGVDVSQAYVDVAVHPRAAFQIAHDERGIAQAMEWLHALQPTLIVLEAMGARSAANGGARRRRATGQLAKTDRLDAQVLARFAEAIRPPVRPVPDEQTQAVAALVARRRQLIEMFPAEKNRLRLMARPIQTPLQAHVAWLKRELASTIRLSPVWREKEEVLRSVPGVGPVLVTTLFADLPELGTPTRKEVAR